MLSKNNKILIGCLVLLLVMSIGYALFSDTITINGSATAKGDFNLVTTCDMDASGVENEDKGSVTDAKITCKDGVVNASVTLGYPGSQKWFRIMVTNEGTIPAKLKKVVELNNPEIMICEKDNCGYGSIENSETYETAEGQSVVEAILYQGYDYNDYQDGELFAEPVFDEEQFDAVLDPGETAYFYVLMNWHSSSNVQSPEPLIANLNAQLTWEQVTE